jgi:uncharacterized protein (TIGR00369 family)
MTDAPTPDYFSNSDVSIPARIGARPDLVDLTRGSIEVVPQICHAGSIYGSALMMLADTVVGLRLEAEYPEWTFTTDFTLRVIEPVASARLTAAATPLRVGKSLIVEAVDVFDAQGEPVAHMQITFMRTPLRGDEAKLDIGALQERMATQKLVPLDGPLVAVTGMAVEDASVGRVSLTPDDSVRRPGGFVQGSIMTLLGEAAATALGEHHHGRRCRVDRLDARYLIGGRTGPLVTEARWLGVPGESDIVVYTRDNGRDDRITTTYVVGVSPVAQTVTGD